MRKFKALFLDRDGVVNVDKPYLYRREDFQFQDGIFELCRAAQSQGYLLVVVTNQAGIARGYYTEADFMALTAWMIREASERQVRIAAVYHCPFHPIHGKGNYRSDSPDRKPQPGMLLRARADLNIDLQSSVLIGNQLTDIEAANAAGVGTKILLCEELIDTEVSRDYHIAGSLDEIRRRFFPTLPDERERGACSRKT